VEGRKKKEEREKKKRQNGKRAWFGYGRDGAWFGSGWVAWRAGGSKAVLGFRVRDGNVACPNVVRGSCGCLC
jgi:hypothetical protein